MACGLRSKIRRLTTRVAASQFHKQVELKTFQTEYTHFSCLPVTSFRRINSFFEHGKTGTGTRLPVGAACFTSPVYTANPGINGNGNGSVATNFSFAAKNVYPGSVPKVKILLSGRYGSRRGTNQSRQERHPR
jgi:hypothetical protein